MRFYKEVEVMSVTKYILFSGNIKACILLILVDIWL